MAVESTYGGGHRIDVNRSKASGNRTASQSEVLPLACRPTLTSRSLHPPSRSANRQRDVLVLARLGQAFWRPWLSMTVASHRMDWASVESAREADFVGARARARPGHPLAATDDAGNRCRSGLTILYSS
jgi:hypothetical protein